ncbi:sensor histidine kinase [Micromonospora sp. CB01531]|uniref:sensor histidine kinase n=1 Tax=Micromonospora sp. CB01531 TaxID=1718947 RepID=UPI00093A2AF8|nr:nitrate- and nitrite sensing domain-containing protein [Micromonospora sp. CB01531]OKI89156.1 histidine kinase [Micromonospora sp. CB01531]
MRSRSTNVRTKVVAMLVSLTALWAFAAWVTLRDGLNLLWVNTLNSTVYEPSAPLLSALQNERRLTLAYLGGPGNDSQARAALEAQRRESEQLAASFKESAQSWQADLAGSDKLGQRLDATYASLDGLAATRESVNARTIDRTSAGRSFADAIDSIFSIYHAMASLDDKEIAGYAAALIQLNRMSELISQEDALMSGILASGRLTSAEYAQFAQLVGAQRFAGAETSTKLSADDRLRYEQLLAGDAFSRLRSIEDQVVQSANTRSKAPAEAAQWRRAVDDAQGELQSVVTAGGNGIVSGATGVAIMVIVRLLLAAGLGTLAVIASIILSITTARALVAQLERLRKAAHDLADERLPNVVERLGHGEQVDVAVEAPPLAFGSDEIGQVGEAFNRVQETAIRTAVEQAELRRNVRDVFLSLARRTQGLVHRQVTLLDAMERREHDADDLEDLFRVDHLATRMRRNAENLIVLSGAAPGRAWRRDVPMIDVARAATQEVEDYTRVNVLPFGSVGLTGRAAGDIIHLLAELVENALSFSPPNTEVEVRGQLVARGFVIEVEDRGLGMSEEELAAANDRIANPTEFNLANANQLGLFVVSHLAQRHDLSVNLKTSPYGGTTAVVLIPMELVTSAEALTAAAGQAGGPSAGEPTASLHDGLPAAVERRGSVALTEAPPARQPTLELPAVGMRAPVRPAAEDATPVEKAAPVADAAPVAEPGSAGTPLVPRQRPAADRTPQGLPVRVRQASLAPQLRADADPAVEAPAEADPGRSPEQIRQLMSRYQSGTRRGRDDARLLGDEDEQPPAADDSPAAGTDR